MKKFFTVYYKPLLVLILSLAFFTRIVRLHVPDTYIFDEVYHALTAKLIARNDPRAFEWWNSPVEPNTSVDWLHPPLAKYTQALPMKILGETSFAWRISSVIFGILVIAAVAKLSDQLFDDKRISLLAAFLTSMDGLLLVQSRIAMNDIHVTFFILLTFIFYHQRLKNPNRIKYLLLAVLSAGLAMATKWSGIFALGFVGIWEIYLKLKSIKQEKLFSTKQLNWLATRFVLLIIIPITIYIASYSMMFAQGKTLICNQEEQIQGECYFETFTWHDKTLFSGYVSHFVELHKQIWWYQTNLEATHTYQSRPIDWFLNIRPVWFHVNRDHKGMTANIYAQGNSMLFWIGDIFIFVSLGLILLNLSAIVIRSLSKIKKIKTSNYQLPTTNYAQPITYNLLAYLIVWLPWQLSPRIMFFYHYTPAVPLLAINLAYWLIKITDTKTPKLQLYPDSKHSIILGQLIVFLVFFLIFLNFVIWFPHWTAIPVPDWWANNVYFVYEGWK